LGVKRMGLEADHSPSSSVEIKNAWSYTSTLPADQRENFSFTLTLHYHHQSLLV